jgi:peptidoglycan/LPS O-acetylase OafA/YrhL
MKNILSKQQAAILAALLIVLIAAIPVGFKTWFVAESGNMKIMPGIGPLVALGLVMRWRWAFPLAKVLSVISMGFVVVLFLINADYRPGYLLLLLLNGLLLLLLFTHDLNANPSKAMP